MFNILDSSPDGPLCVPGSRGRLRLFIGDRAHIPMYTALGRLSTCSEAHTGTNTSYVAQNHCTAHDPVVAGPSHFPQTDGTQTARSVQPGVYQSRPISRVGGQSGETLWVCTIARSPNRPHGGINQLLAEQIRAPGSLHVLASQGPVFDKREGETQYFAL